MQSSTDEAKPTSTCTSSCSSLRVQNGGLCADEHRADAGESGASLSRIPSKHQRSVVILALDGLSQTSKSSKDRLLLGAVRAREERSEMTSRRGRRTRSDKDHRLDG